ncbi:hypothetical protein PR202_ga22693 [Eleusine coracana subsp. coracana]|uniref:Uncharacterized protein n=1 Tax=Eleusine coracana subsp. coracana TaxID=191504 RepID=A0AAV5D4L8_ELECO|nr:hypothetical protein PR202_ga22693 [Eleusine coracana subsp. coracana]
MNKELDPPALLIMSPDELKLECTSCGHTWFSSYDADSSQSAERPCTASVAGNTEAGDTAARVADPKKKQHVKSRSRLVRSDTKRSKFDAIPEDESV